MHKASNSELLDSEKYRWEWRWYLVERCRWNPNCEPWCKSESDKNDDDLFYEDNIAKTKEIDEQFNSNDDDQECKVF